MNTGSVPGVQKPRGVEKNFCAFIPRNPLISLDLDERIQGNPTLMSGVFAAKQTGAKKTQIDETSLRPTAGEGPDPAPFKREAASIVGASGFFRLEAIEGAGRGFLGRQANGPRIIERPLSAGMKFGPGRRHDGMGGRDPHRGS